ncbi:MAG: hypothetical protein K5851_04725 [Lachnospiraceae bacterium]|nr:hypothetical protein [Lachnospiraceae bacterium]
MSENNSTKNVSIKDKMNSLITKCKKNETVRKFLENRPLMILTAFAILTLVLICVNTFALNIPVVAVCSIAILEIVLLNLLDGSPIYLHAVAVVFQIALGIFFGKALFMVLNVALYIVGLLIFINEKNRA